MKKSQLVLLSLVPIVVGYIVNVTLLLPVIGMFSFYVLPLLTTAFWFYLGRQYARTDWKTIPAILIGNAGGILSLLVYLWQFLLVSDEARILPLAGASQMFSASVPTYLLARIALLFESQPNYIGRTSMVALQVLSLIYMILVFSAGVLWEKKIQNRLNNEK
jgi:hypothetical protein